MQAIYDTFEDRKEEIRIFFKALDDLNSLSILKKSKDSYLDSNFIKILNANCLLMIYNLVESTIMNGILEIYDKLKSEGTTYLNASKYIKKIWFSFKFKEAYDQNAHFNTYKNKAEEILDFIITKQELSLTRKATDINGNLDANKIFNICNDHGINYKLNRKCKGGKILETVKNRRNQLAHGTCSFTECGREYSIEELKEISNEVNIFLENILDGMRNYCNDNLYLNKNIEKSVAQCSNNM